MSNYSSEEEDEEEFLQHCISIFDDIKLNRQEGKDQQETEDYAKQLRNLGFEYRVIPCAQHQIHDDDDNNIECNNTNHQAVCLDCQTRLFFIENNDCGVEINAENQKDYVPKGPKFDDVSLLCQKFIQENLIKRYKLQTITIPNDDDDDPINYNKPLSVLVTPLLYEDTKSPILIIIPGKGESRAGILSVKQIVLSGLEVGSTEFYLHRASLSGISTILLDPNTYDTTKGLSCMTKSLSRLFQNSRLHDRPILFLAHSAAGGYLVRYLLLGDRRHLLRSNTRAICFTDSTHNIQWTKQDNDLYTFLQSDRCLYVRHTGTHHTETFAKSEDRRLGDEIPHEDHWKRRFGNIRTVWAGTTEHSLICWTARHIIWDFFESHLKVIPDE
jgi:hypothetical protein